MGRSTLRHRAARTRRRAPRQPPAHLRRQAIHLERLLRLVRRQRIAERVADSRDSSHAMALPLRTDVLVRESAAVYRQGRPQRSVLYRLLEDRFEEFAWVHEDRFEREDGPLRPVVRTVVQQFLDCGVPENGFARVRCPKCRAEYFVPFSCQTRGLCPSCAQKRALLFAEKLRDEILAPVNHRHVVFTIPIPLRRLFLRERRLLGILTRSAYETVRRCFCVLLGEKEGRPGMVAALQTFGSKAQWHPHVHALVTDGLILPGGTFVPGPAYDEDLERLLTETFRRLVLLALHREERLSESFLESLLTWRHGGGLSVYARHQILNEEPARLAHIARYLVRAPVATGRVHGMDDGRVLLEIPPDPGTGATALVVDPLEWLRRLTHHIPDARMHLVRYYGAYANRARERYRVASEVPCGQDDEDEEIPEAMRRRRRSWARLLKLVFEVDLLCPRCGAQLAVVSVLTDPQVVDRVLAHVREEEVELLFDPRAPPAA